MRGKLWLVGFFALGLVACGGAPVVGGRPAVGDKAVAAAPVKPAEAPKPAMAAPAAAAPAAPAAARNSPAGQASMTESQAVSDRPWDRMIIRNATLALRVENVERALGAVRQLAGKYGGFVAASNTRLDRNGDREQMFATATIQVRADAFDAAISDLRGLAVKVENENGTSQDVTEEYVDLNANLHNLQSTEKSLVSLMEKATKLEDVLTLQRELTNVRSQIERIQGRKKFLERRSDFSQITVALQEVDAAAAPRPIPTTAWDPARTFDRGWQASLRVLRGIADVAILALAFGWWMLPFAAVGGLLLLRRRPRPTPPGQPA